MNPLSATLFLILGTLLLSVPRKWALAPFLAGCCLMTTGQGIELGSISLPMFRMLMLVGCIRVVLKGERIVGRINTVDKLLLCWAGWYILSSFFHDPKYGSGPVYVCGGVFNLLVFYFLVRIWCCDLDDTTGIIRIVAILLVPIAFEMMMEKATGKNLFSVFGGVPESSLVREGKIRAQGPFMHPILAGTVGATCVPLFVGIYQKHRNFSIMGIGAGIIMVFASASSGPVMSLMAAMLALAAWRYRHLMKTARVAFVVAYIVLMMVMERPPYYLISKIDISGGSTGWHRSFLIEQTLKYFPEWWLFGTDFTRHWMPLQGVASSPTHTDITNYYIGFAVGGGLPALAFILLALAKSFGWVGMLHREMFASGPDRSFMIWCFGAALFSHAVTSISVAYFDQSVIFFWLNVAVISSMYSVTFLADGEEREDAGNPARPASAGGPDYDFRGKVGS